MKCAEQVRNVYVRVQMWKAVYCYIISTIVAVTTTTTTKLIGYAAIASKHAAAPDGPAGGSQLFGEPHVAAKLIVRESALESWAPKSCVFAPLLLVCPLDPLPQIKLVPVGKEFSKHMSSRCQRRGGGGMRDVNNTIPAFSSRDT